MLDGGGPGGGGGAGVPSSTVTAGSRRPAARARPRGGAGPDPTPGDRAVSPAAVPPAPAPRGPGAPSLRPVEASTLVERFRDGDPDAVREVYRQHAGAVLGVTQRALSDRGLAEEAVQQTFLQAWRSAASVDPTRDIGPWLYTIARRVAIDIWRRESRRAAESYDAAPPGAPTDPALVTLPPSLERAWDAWQVREAVDGLPTEEQRIIRLQHFEGFTHAEIAEQLDIPVGTVKSRSFRAHKRLAGALGHLVEVDA